MQQKTKPITIMTAIERHVLIFVLLLSVLIAAVYFLVMQESTLSLLQEQVTQLESNERILAQSEQLYAQYRDNIAAVVDVFPDERTVLDAVEVLETTIQSVDPNGNVRSTFQPMPEADKLYLMFTLTATLPPEAIQQLLLDIETLPYMTRLMTMKINFIEAGSPVNVAIGLKLYVKNPFII